MNKLGTKERAQILAVLCEGMGINAATRITGVSKNTVLKLLADAGEACAIYQDEVMRGLNLNRIECDEIWSFVGMKQKNVPNEMRGLFGIGDVYTWTAIDAETKLVPCCMLEPATLNQQTILLKTWLSALPAESN